MADNNPQPNKNPQPANNQQSIENKRWPPPPEFILVVIMLFVLTGLVLYVIWIPLDNNPCAGVPVPAATDATLYVAQTSMFDKCLEYRTDLVDRRKDFLALLISAFGAWVGAGAAYFFGRENLRVAADSLLQMQKQTSGVDRLRTTLVNQVPPIALGWLAKETDKLGAAYDWLKADPMRWFIPVVKDDGSLLSVLKGEALLRFLIDAPDASPPLSPPGDVLDMTIGEALKYINDRDEYKQFRQVYVTVSGNMSVETANELMDRQGIFLAIVVDDKRKPTHFITTSEIRKLLLK